MGLAFWLALRCNAPKPLASWESERAPTLRCSRRRRHRGDHRTAFGLTWPNNPKERK